MVKTSGLRESNPRMLVLVRHARTGSNARRVVSARNDEPLSPDGERQCVLNRERLATDLTRKEYFPSADHIYSSPLLRARESAAAMASSVELDLRLTEIDTGDLAGRTWDEINAKYPNYHSRLRREGFNFRNPEGSESFGQATNRLESFARERLAFADHVVAMTHADILRLFACKVIGLHPRSWNQLFVANLGFMAFAFQNEAFSLHAIVNPAY